MSTNSPIPLTRLAEITDDAITSTLHSATAYDHASTSSWNTNIINALLKKLIDESSTPSTADESTSAESAAPKYKFCVNSTIIQNLSDPSPAKPSSLDGDETVNGKESSLGRRGMHSASGAYWNNEKDGMWSHKYQDQGEKGMDVVVSVMWIGV